MKKGFCQNFQNLSGLDDFMIHEDTITPKTMRTVNGDVDFLILWILEFRDY